MAIKFTLKKRKASRKDYSFHKSHAVGAAPLPDNFNINVPQLVQDTEDCSAFSACDARDGSVPGANFDPATFWSDELQFAGVSGAPDGFDIEVPAAVGVEIGFAQLPDLLLRTNKASAYFWITPNNGMDLFDAVRSAIYSQNRPVVGGLTWMNEWMTVAGGYITTLGKTVLGGHAICITGWKTVNGVVYIALKNTWGVNFGDNGTYWMSRDIFNEVFVGYGIYQWSDDPSSQIKTLGLLSALLQNVITLLKNIV